MVLIVSIIYLFIYILHYHFTSFVIYGDYCFFAGVAVAAAVGATEAISAVAAEAAAVEVLY